MSFFQTNLSKYAEQPALADRAQRTSVSKTMVVSGRVITDKWTLSAEQKAKISAIHKGKPKSAEWRAKMTGRTHSAETRAKMSASRKGKTFSAETRAKIGAAGKGKAISAEHRASISKPMMTPNGVFPSKNAVAVAANTTTVTIARWMKKYPEHYYYLPKEA
jgi:hypothetical protein